MPQIQMKKYLYFIWDHVTNFMQNNSKIKTLADLWEVFGGGEIQPKDNREKKMRLILIYKTLLNEYFINYVRMTDK